MSDQETIAELRAKLARAEAACAEMREILDVIWDRDGLGSVSPDPEGQSASSFCKECDAHLPHGACADDCVTGKMRRALSADCGRGFVSVGGLEPWRQLAASVTCDDISGIQCQDVNGRNWFNERSRLESLVKGATK